MYEKIIKRIEEEKRVVNIGLFTHKNPDYDAVCSTLTLSNYLKDRFNDRVRIYPVLDQFSFDLNINSNLPIYREISDVNLDYCIALDVNEQDLIYDFDSFNTVKLENRYLFDHHTGNRKELPVLDKQKLVRVESSSTCEVLGLDLLQDNSIDKFNAYNLYLGIASDTAGFTRQIGNLTYELIELLNLDEEVKNDIIVGVTCLTPVQRELYNSIKEEVSDFENLKLYKLSVKEEEADKIKELKNKFIEEKITPRDLDVISILMIECGTAVFLKIRKSEDSELDILTMAEKCNGGGHSNRCAGRFFDKNYEEVLSYINSLFNELYSKEKSIVKKN